MALQEVMCWKEQTFEPELDFYNGFVKIYKETFPALIDESGVVIIPARTYYTVCHIKHSGIVKKDQKVYKTARAAYKHAVKVAVLNDYTNTILKGIQS